MAEYVSLNLTRQAAKIMSNDMGLGGYIHRMADGSFMPGSGQEDYMCAREAANETGTEAPGLHEHNVTPA